jgi:hypothetical protein
MNNNKKMITLQIKFIIFLSSFCFFTLITFGLSTNVDTSFSTDVDKIKSDCQHNVNCATTQNILSKSTLQENGNRKLWASQFPVWLQYPMSNPVGSSYFGVSTAMTTTHIIIGAPGICGYIRPYSNCSFGGTGWFINYLLYYKNYIKYCSILF